MQRVEGEDSSSTASKEEDPTEESLKMKELLEQANVMLKSLTTTSQNPASFTSTAESKEEVMDRLQQQLNQLKLKVFKINQMLVPEDSKLKEEEVPELEAGAPNFDAKEDALEDQGDDKEGEVQGVFDDEDEEKKEERAPEGEGRKEEEKKAPEGEEKKGAEGKDGPKEFETRTFRLAAPMFSNKSKEVVRATKSGHPQRSRLWIQWICSSMVSWTGHQIDPELQVMIHVQMAEPK